MHYNSAVDAQRNLSERLDFVDATKVLFLSTELLFENHAAYIYTNRIFQQVQNEIVEAHQRCRMTHFEMEDNTEIYTITDSLRNKVVVRHEVGTESYHCDFSLIDRKRVVTAKLHSLYIHLVQRAQSNDDDIVALFDGMEELSQKLFGGTVPSWSSMDKAQRIEGLYGASRPSVVNVHPPDVVSTKGSGSSSGK
ncbi:hypothetical protein SASPL_153782 [Salvia splendens]|uniref:Uncharacterized protein n=2 Tax=Salvia splendens TaxID=180675 RepID=A0A8X8YYN4_SALSN|nr:hypothetical protein SASPL_153782 [Salvia splendens]